MSIPIRNLEYIRSKDPKYAEALDDIRNYISNSGQAGAYNPSGQPASPPNISSLKVTAQDGIFHAVITDNSNIYRNVNYFLEYSDKADFSNSHQIPLLSSRSYRGALGGQTLHFRAQSQYISGGPASALVIHGSGNRPTPVNGGSSATGPAIPISTGSGTNLSPAGGQGAGRVAYSKTTNGRPPTLS
jgi:hypothetical protein